MCEQPDRPFEPSSSHLLISGGERRYLQEFGIFDITRIAKAISIGLLPAIDATFTTGEIASMHAGVRPHNRDEEHSRFSSYLLRFNAIVCQLPDGVLRLVDGRKRVRQAIREGSSEVRAAVFAFEDARSLDLIDESRSTSKIVEATQDSPLEADGHDFIRDALVATEVYPSEGGRPALSPLQSQLQSFMIYFWNALIDCEDFVRKKYPQAGLLPRVGRVNKNKEDWAPVFFKFMMRHHDLPFSLSYDVVKNNAASAIRSSTMLRTRSEFKTRAVSDWALMSEAALVAERDVMVTSCVLLTKATFRLNLMMTAARRLYRREYDDLPIDYLEVHDEYYQRDTKPPKWLTPSRQFVASRLRLEDQLLVTTITGISMTRVYGVYNYLDPLFEAHILSFNLTHYGFSEVSVGLVETAAYRRDMMMAGIEDVFSPYWDEVFEFWLKCGVNDQVLLQCFKLKEHPETFDQLQTLHNPYFRH